ncbi:MAG: aminoglycoside phosphotransferase family protein [Bdellovibrionales bacterium]|nr:aminoglycoside phosphotransferase family protein [Bdellovibrionales bacterium]
MSGAQENPQHSQPRDENESLQSLHVGGQQPYSPSLTLEEKRQALSKILCTEGHPVLGLAHISHPITLPNGLRNVTVRSADPSHERSLLRSSFHEPAWGDNIVPESGTWSRYHKELAVSQLLQRHGVITPQLRRVHYFEASLGAARLPEPCAAVICDYVEGRNLEMEIHSGKYVQGAAYRYIGEIARSIHNIPTQGFGHLWDVTQSRFQHNAWADYVEDFFFPEQIDLLEALKVLSAPEAENLRHRYQEALEWSVSPTLAHGDLLPRNFIVRPDQTLVAIDLELAFSGPALFYEIAQVLQDDLLSAEPAGLRPLLEGLGISDSRYETSFKREAETLACFGLLARIYPSYWAHHPARDWLQNPPFFSRRAAVSPPEHLWRERFRLGALLQA